ncbi:hypothetical protein [Sphingosinicella sp. BN140058]|uniref:hypothetical protein n=1 Tax=Sphingosinicella sp. BN140058 TaxID=1892855 RepID=UPI0010134372|nr:hypothetical protein [Sphingosinicella sp. BN140058]QAY76503.1 hypothetical protein ETR14_08355 [Sphingosinicella sp. BN140058]
MIFELAASLALAWSAAAAPVAHVDTPSLDIFIGTLAVDKGEVILTRCDLGETRYRLHDGPGAQTVARYRANPGPAYAEVVASYGEQAGLPVLTVAEFAEIVPGRSCHLREAAETLATDAQVGTSEAAAAKAQDLTGHYYLTGVTEVGSELLLRPDGTFEWFLAYGAIDQAAHGKWRREGEAILLVADLSPADRPLFAFVAAEPWNAEAAEEVLERRQGAQNIALLARCPFLPGMDVIATTAPPILPGAAPVPAATLRDRAAAALRKAISARADVERLARKTMAGKSQDLSPGDVEAARDAAAAWRAARAEAMEAARAAGLPEPDLADPVLPAACALPMAADAAPPPTGLGVQVADLESGTPLRRVDVSLRFADGRIERMMTTGSGGYAFVEGPAGSAAVGATLHVDQEPERDATFAFPPVSSGILRFSMDRKQLALPAFTDLRLRIDDGALLLGGPGDGRYQRRP